MSISEKPEFNNWLSAFVRQHGEFTALVMLTEIEGDRVTPLASTFFHVLGDEVTWNDIVVMFNGSGHEWHGAAFFPTKGDNIGPVDTPTAHARLRELEQKVTADRMVLNDGQFFDTLGRRIKIEPISGA